jgi:hypothetical protein
VTEKSRDGFLSEPCMLTSNPEVIQLATRCSLHHVVSGYENEDEEISGNNFGKERTLRRC